VSFGIPGEAIRFLFVLIGSLLVEGRLVAMMATVLKDGLDARFPFFTMIT
jgi:hypothetical protein